MKPFSAITYGLGQLAKNWKVIVLVFVINFIFGLIAIAPFKNMLIQNLGNTAIDLNSSQGFDFTLWTELLRANKSFLPLEAQLFSILFIIYVLWTVFYTAGFTNLIVNSKDRKTTSFWAGGAYYFFRFLRLTIYTALFISLIIFILLGFTGIFNAHVLDLESEMQLIFRFKIAGILMGIMLFFVGLFSDLAKVKIARTHATLITTDLWKSIKDSFRLRYIILGILWFIFYGLVIGLFYIVTMSLSLNPVVLGFALIPQVFIILKIALGYSRLASIEYMDDSPLV